MGWLFLLGFLVGKPPAVTSAPDSLTQPQWEDKWFAKDKAHHFFYSFGITGLSYHVYHCQFHNPNPGARTFAISTAAFTGISKELFDRICLQHPISYKDIAADALGITAAVLLFTLYNP